MALAPPNRKIVGIVQVGFALALLAVVWYLVDGGEALRLLAGARLEWIVAAALALSAQTVLSAWRWQLTARTFGIDIGRGLALREYYVSQIVNQTLPGGVLGDAGRVIRTRRQAGVMASGQAVVWERLAGQVALIAVLVVALLTTAVVPGGAEWPGWLITTVALVVGGALVVILSVVFVAGRFPGWFGHQVKALVRSATRAWWSPSVRVEQVGLSAATALLNVAGFAMCAWAIGADFPYSTALALVPLILFTMLVPVTVSGWGLREGAAAALFPLVGATAAEGLAASVAFGLVLLAISLPGLAAVALPSKPIHP